MLDENFPAFFYKKSPDGVPHHRAIFLSHQGSEPEPCYELHTADPSATTSKNLYAAALFDSFNPDVLYGEVLVSPGWTQPTLSQEEMRRNGGVPPPPSPVLPTEFTVQLYNPDQQVTVVQKPGSWGGSACYEFSLPQTTFRTPSASNLDRTQHDPAALANTPKINFVWRKESMLGKDMTCYMTGKSTDTIVKKKHRDPDIAIALFRSLRELTVYEPNLFRVEVEDPKGLEVVMLLSAAVIKDLYFSNNIRELFNISPLPPSTLSNGRTISSPGLVTTGSNVPIPSSNTIPLKTPPHRKPLPNIQTAQPTAGSSAAPAAIDPRAQWEIEAETARLRAQVEAEERERQRVESARRREREKADEAETRRLRKMVEAEEREARRRQEEIDRETERLRKAYGVKPPPISDRQQRHSVPSLEPIPQGQQPALLHQRSQFLRPSPGSSSQQTPARGPNGLYLQPNKSTYASTGAIMSGGNPNASNAQAAMKGKKSFFGLRSTSDDGERKLQKKASIMW